MADHSLAALGVLESALGNEHYEMSAYEALLIPFTKMGVSDAVKVLQFNLDHEIHTSDEPRKTLQRISG